MTTTPECTPTDGQARQDRLNLMGELEVALKVLEAETAIRRGFATTNPLPEHHPALLRVRRLCAEIWGEE